MLVVPFDEILPQIWITNTILKNQTILKNNEKYKYNNWKVKSTAGLQKSNAHYETASVLGL